MKRVVVTTDFSEESKVAFKYALEQARLLGVDNVRIFLLNVVSDRVPVGVQFEFGVSYVDTRGVIEAVYKEAVQNIDAIAKERFPGIAIETSVVRSSAPTHVAILDFLREHQIEMLIMATHGRTGFAHLLIGSVAERVIREAPCPILVVPARE